ncbi:MAG: hypothetical protein LQ340_003009, partial [Diploschistes diacapsis]
MKEEVGIPHRNWINSVPNDGLIRYTHIFNRERVLLASPKALSEVLVTKSYEFQKPADARYTLGRLLGFGVLLAEGDEHRQQRKNLMPAFKYHHIRDLYSVFWEKSSEMVDAVVAEIAGKNASNIDTNSKGTITDMGNWLSRCTLDIIGIAGMGFNFNAIHDPNNELNQIYRRVFGGGNSFGARSLFVLSQILPLGLLTRLPLQRNRDITSAAQRIRSVSRSLITEKQAKMRNSTANAGPTGDKDILSVALSSGGFSVENLVDQTMTFLAAGHETTATATSWALLELAQRPALQARLRAEIRAQLPPPRKPDGHAGAPMTADLMDRCVPLLHAVCNEVLRFHAPVPITRRVAVHDTTVLGQRIPKGTSVFVVPWAVNFSTEQWGADAGEFKPERWLGEGKANSGGAESNFSNLTFLHGPRSCIGMGFARAEFACLLAAVVGRLELGLTEEQTGAGREE